MTKPETGPRVASNPLAVTLSHERLRKMCPEMYGPRAWLTLRSCGGLYIPPRMLRWQVGLRLLAGDSRSALVAALDPLLVAAYTDELDCVALLEFPREMAQQYGLKRGQKLISINTYAYGKVVASDLVEGPRTTGSFVDFCPLIADFLTDDRELLQARKREIEEEEWQRMAAQTRDRLARLKECPARNGRPPYCMAPAAG